MSFPFTVLSFCLLLGMVTPTLSLVIVVIVVSGARCSLQGDGGFSVIFGERERALKISKF